MADQQKGKAWPVANATLTNQASKTRFCNTTPKLIRKYACLDGIQILDLVQQASQYKQLKKGANEGEDTRFPLIVSCLYNNNPLSYEDLESRHC